MAANLGIFIVLLASDHGGFIGVQSIYVEPMPVSGQYRVLLELGSSYSLYEYSLPKMSQRVSSNLVCPQTLNRSL